MKANILFIVLIFLAACAPEDRPIKGGKNDPNGDDKIQESAYNGSILDVASYSAYRVLDAKRVMDIALLWQKLYENNAEFDLSPGFQLLKSCGQGNKGIYIDVLEHTKTELRFYLEFDNCSVQSSRQLSTKLFGIEEYNIKFRDQTIGHKFKRIITEVEYKTTNFRHNFKANDKNLRYPTDSSIAKFKEDRDIHIELRRSGEYFYKYKSKGEFEQRMLSKSFEALENNGVHNYSSKGNFTLREVDIKKRGKVVKSFGRVDRVIYGDVELTHEVEREVILRNSGRSLFTNESNNLEFSSDIDGEGLTFEGACSFVEGKLMSTNYVNQNQERNQFFVKLDNDLTNKNINFTSKFNTGKDPENIIINSEGMTVQHSIDVKCLQKPESDKLTDLAQPKVPFDLLFIR